MVDAVDLLTEVEVLQGVVVAEDTHQEVLVVEATEVEGGDSFCNPLFILDHENAFKNLDDDNRFPDSSF